MYVRFKLNKHTHLLNDVKIHDWLGKEICAIEAYWCYN